MALQNKAGTSAAAGMGYLGILLTWICVTSFPAYGAWRPDAPLEIEPNTETTVTLRSTAAVDGGSTTSTNGLELWLMNDGTSELLHPEKVTSEKGVAAIPVFARGHGKGDLHIFDTSTGTTNTVEWLTKSIDENSNRWIPRLEITGSYDLPLAYANQKVTATLTLSGGTGEMPPTVHIQATDHRGRMVLASHYSTFDLMAGQATVIFPAAGYYQVSITLLQDPVTSLPRAAVRDPKPIPFGKTVIDMNQSELLPEGVTTDTIVGTLVSLEHLPTTATVVGRDRFTFPVFGKHSREIQKNRWPFSIAGADLIKMPVSEHMTRGAELLRWQRRLGSSFSPITLEWGEAHLSPNRYTWSLLNSVFNTHRQIMVRPIVTLLGRTNWDNSLPTETSATLDAWTGFTRHLSEKYLKLMWGLQVWDYPQDTWQDPEEYAKLVNATLLGYTSRNGQLIAAPPVLVSGTKGGEFSFLDAALTSETAIRVSLTFDFAPKDPKVGPEAAGLAEALDRAANVLASNGAPGRQISVSKIANPNGPGGVTSNLQANYMVRAYVVAMSKNVYKIHWDNLYDRSNVPWTPNLSDRTGLLDNQLKPKLSGVAYNIMSYMMSGATIEEVSSQDGATIYKFNLPLQDNKWAGTVYVAWTESPNQVQDIRLEMTHGGGVYALDYLGAEVHARKVAEDSANSIEGSYQIPVGFEPVFIWDAGKPGVKE